MNMPRENIQYGNIDEREFIIKDGVLTKYSGSSDTVVIPEGVREISSSAFMGCRNIVMLVIPDSVTCIDRYSFVSCTSLKEVTIGFGVKEIPMGCFGVLPALETITMCDVIETIDDFAFRNCKALKSITFITKKYRDPITAEEKGKAFEMMLSGKPAKIEYVDIADAVPAIRKIGNYAFYGCNEIDLTELKNKAIEIGLNSFSESEQSDNMSAEVQLVQDTEIKPDAEAVYFDDEEESADSSNDSCNETMVDTTTFENAFAKDEVSTAEDQTDDVTLDETETENREEYLIPGFEIVEASIKCVATGEIIKDAPIAVLNLSVRSYNCLYRIKETIAQPPHTDVMVSDVLSIAKDDLMNVRNMGAKSVEEIIEKIKSYLIEGINGGEEVIPTSAYTIAPEYELVDGVITNKSTHLCVPDELVDGIGLSIRASNSLRRGGISMLSQLICQSQQKLRNFPNMGAKTVTEISEIIPKYLKSHETDKITVDELEETVQVNLDGITLPELNPEIPVLAEEYAVVDGIIYSRKTYKAIQDAPIEVLNLSVRAMNCVCRDGNRTIASLIGYPYDEFRKIRNLGTLSAQEIQEKLELYLDSKQKESSVQATSDHKVSATSVLKIFSDHEFESFTYDLIKSNFEEVEDENLQEALDKLVENGQVVKAEDNYSLYLQSFFDYIDGLDSTSGLDERAIRILQMRASGSTLEEVGQLEGATRERIRQIEKKSIDRITRRATMLFAEDKFAYVFSTYAFDKEFYFDYLGETKQIWYYLNFRYTRGKTDYNEALHDERISTDVRRAVDKYIHKGFVEIDGVYIPAQRGDIEDFVVEKYCKDEVTLDEFFELYDQFLLENDLSDEKLQVTESMRMTRSNRLSESNRLLWKQNQRLRFYDIEGGDYTELFETLNLGQYKDIELSSRKFLVDYPELMARYDLRDEYEVHNLLKKIHAETENPDLVFGRMPNLQFGTFDRDAAVREILFAMAPVSQDDLAEMISLEYGVRPETIKANWLNCISEYYYQGMYSVDYEEMPEEHIALLKEILTDDFYFLTELRKIYSRLIPGADLTLLSTYNLKKMGFLVGASYVVQNYPTAEAFFNHLLTDSDVVDVAPISKRYMGLTPYYAYLARLKHDMEIIEFEPFQYINIRRLQKLGFTKKRLREYSDRVWSYLVDDEFFTIQSLRRTGFEDELDSLGFGDMFYSSLLKEDDRFSWQRVGNNVVLNPKGNQFTVHDFLVDRITKERSIDADDFVDDLAEIYGITFDKHEIVEKTKGSEVYYDSIMGKLYADYATYFEEI